MKPSNDNSFGSFGASGGGIVDVNVGANPNPSSNANTNVNTNTSADANITANMNYNVPTSTGTGDIIIEGDKKSKKGLIVGLTLLVGVIIVGGMVAAIIFLGQRGESARDKFNKLINYVVSGEESTANYTGAYNDETEYYFNEQQKNTENRSALYEKTSKLLNDFMVSYNALENKGNNGFDVEKFERIMNNEKGILDFVGVVGLKKVPDVYDVAGVYNNDKNATKQWFDNYYDFSNVDESEYVDGFKDTLNAFANAQIERIGIYYDKGCVSGSTIRSGCVEGSGDEALIAEHDALIGKIKKIRADLEYYNTLGKTVVEKMIKANDLVKNSGFAFIGGIH